MRNLTTFRAGLIACLLLLTSCATGGQDSARGYDTPATDIPLPPARIAVVDIESGTILADKRADEPVPPASTIKVATAISAMDTLAADRRFTTRLCLTESGALLLEGGGAPYLSLNDLKELSLAFPAVTVARFAVSAGDFPVEERIAPTQPVDAAYNPKIAGLLAAEGAYRRAWNTGAQGAVEPVRIPDLPSTESAKGDVANAVPGLRVWRSVEDSVLYTGEIFRQFVQERGIPLPTPERMDDTSCDKEVAAVESAPTADLIRQMLDLSSNPMAEMIGIHAVVERGNEPSSIAEAAGHTKDWLASRFSGVDWRGFNLPNHSGLSIDARVSARQMAGLLASAYRIPGLRTLPAYLSPAGWDGGLRNRLTSGETALKVWGKTGTIHYAVGVVGYLFSDTAPPRAFAIYIYDEERRAAYNPVMHDPPPEVETAAKAWDRQARAKIDAILTSIARGEPIAGD